VSITVRELVEAPQLRISVLAGSSGLDRALTWAHACELPDPTEWLNGGELVLSVGMALSEDPAEQVAYIERLSAVDAGAVAFGDTTYAKELSSDARHAADRLGLPILWVAFEVPYIAVARAVIDTNQQEEQRRLQSLQRAYEAVRSAAETGTGLDGLVVTLAKLARSDLHLLELPYGNAIAASTGAPLDPDVHAALLAQAERRESLPAVLRLDTDGYKVVGVPVQASRIAALVAMAPDRKPDAPLLQHIATILAVELEKRFGERERQRRLGAELLAKLIDQTIEVATAETLLAEHHLDREPRVIVTWRTNASVERGGDLHHRLAARGIPHLLLRRDLYYALVNGDDATLGALLQELAAAGAVGISGPLGRATRAPDAAREGRLALKTADAEHRRSFTYGSANAGSPFVPSSVSDAERIVDSILGPLRAYDDDNNSNLLPSLRAFLENNRSWQRTAERLHIHKQTLHYRMKRVTELTGRRLDSTSDVAALWYALEAEALLRSDPLAAAPGPATD
jgi:purine catabolism regulator